MIHRAKQTMGQIMGGSASANTVAQGVEDSDARPRYPEDEINRSDPQDLQLFPLRIYTPSGDVLLDQKLPGSKTVRSILQTLRTEKRGSLSLLQGTEATRWSFGTFPVWFQSGICFIVIVV